MRIAIAMGLRGCHLFAHRVLHTTPALLVVSLTLGGLAYPTFQGDAKMRSQSAYPLTDGRKDRRHPSLSTSKPHWLVSSPTCTTPSLRQDAIVAM